MYVSLPHFLNAEEKFIKGVDGLKPDQNKHDYIVSFEPITGSAIGINIRLQINYHLEPTKENKILAKNLKNVMLPLFWIEMDVKMNSVVTDGLSTLYLAINLMKIIPLVTIAIGAIMIIMAVILFFVCIVYKGESFKDKYNLSEVSIISSDPASVERMVF